MKVIQRLPLLIWSCALFTLATTTGLYAQDFEWTTQLGGIRLDEGAAITISSSDLVYVAGNIIDTSVVEGDTLLSTNAIAAQISSSGEVLWERQLGGKNQDIATGIGVDGNDNSYVVGSFSDSLTINGTPLNAWNGFDFAFWKYDANGNLVWVQSLTSRGDIKDSRIATDVQGNSYITASFLDSLVVGNDTIVPEGGIDIFMAKYNVDGTLVWWKTFGDIRPEQVQKIGLDGSGHVYLTGSFAETTAFDDQVLQAAGGTDAFLAQLDTDGNVNWAKRVGGTQTDTGNDLFVTTNGHLFLTGQYTNSADFDDQTLMGANHAQIFVAQYDEMGTLQFVQGINSTNDASGTGIVVDEQTGDYWVTGVYDSTLQFDNGTVLNSDRDRFFVAQFSAQQQLRGATQSIGNGFSFSNAMAIDAMGNAYVMSTFTGFLAFDAQALSSRGNFDIGIVKLNPLPLTTAIATDFSTPTSLINVYPNPSSHTIHIRWQQADTFNTTPTQIQLMNTSGQLVWQTNQVSLNGINQYALTVNDFPEGWYIIRLQTGQTIQTQAVQIIR